MTPATLEAIAARIAIPVDRGIPARAYVECVDVRPRTTWRVWFGIDGGRVRVPTEVLFDRGRDARALAKLLNGEGEAVRPASDSTAGIPVPVQAPTGPSLPPAQPAAVGTPRRCLGCGRDLPPGSRPQRLTCSHACREALHAARRPGARGRHAASDSGADVDAALTVSAAPGPSAPVETELELRFAWGDR